MHPERRKSIHDAISRLADGDRAAVPRLVHELWPVLLEFATSAVHHHQDAEDIAQEVFLRICARATEFDNTRDGLSWAFGIASYEIMTHRRRLQRRRETFEPSQLEAYADPVASQEDAAIQHELGAALRTVLGDLSEQELWTLGLGAGNPTPGVSAQALRKRRQRVLDRVRTVWRRLCGEP